MNSRRPLGTIFLGLVLLVVGAVFLLDNLHYIPIGFTWERWWPLILVAVGLWQMVQARSLFSGLFLVALGGVFLLATLDRVAWDEIWKFWPVLLIYFGLSLLFGRRGTRVLPNQNATAPAAGDEVREHALLCGLRREVTSQAFRGGDVTVVMGSVELDLRQAKLDQAGAHLAVSAVMGGVDIWIPADWFVDLQARAVMGAVEDKTRQQVTDSSRKLVIHASAVMGAVEIKN